MSSAKAKTAYVLLNENSANLWFDFLFLVVQDVIIDNYTMTVPNGKEELIRSSEIRLVQGRRYGLMGKNGVGKSTLLHQLAAFKIEGFPRHLNVLHVEQERLPGDERSALQTVVDADPEPAFLEKEEERLTALFEGVLCVCLFVCALADDCGVVCRRVLRSGRGAGAAGQAGAAKAGAEPVEC